MSEFLLVDGNNVIHACADLLELHRHRRGAAHEELCRRLATVHDATGLRVVVVFDGRRGKIVEERAIVGLQIFYSDSGTTADDIIERLAMRYASKFTLTVATNDQLEQNAVIAAGGFAMSVEGLVEKIDRAEKEIGRWTL